MVHIRLKKNSSSRAATKLSYMTYKLDLHTNVNFKTKVQNRSDEPLKNSFVFSIHYANSTKYGCALKQIVTKGIAS